MLTLVNKLRKLEKEEENDMEEDVCVYSNSLFSAGFYNGKCMFYNGKCIFLFS